MKLKFDKNGRRFFFLTFCVRGRKPILSKLVTGRDENGKLTASVVLTELGERIAALWRCAPGPMGKMTSKQLRYIRSGRQFKRAG